MSASSTVFHGPPSRCGSVRSGSDSRLGCHSLPSRASLPYLGKAIATLDTVTYFSILIKSQIARAICYLNLCVAQHHLPDRATSFGASHHHLCAAQHHCTARCIPRLMPEGRTCGAWTVSHAFYMHAARDDMQCFALMIYSPLG